MDLIRDLGIAGFLFFLIKGLIWVFLFFLAYFGLIKKDKAQKIKERLFFWRRKKKDVK
jgi:hypothetical protein